MLLGVSLNLITIPVALVLIGFTIPFTLKVFDNNRELAEKVVYRLLMFLLVYKTIHYVLYCTTLEHPWNQLVPVEISQVSYFLFPIAFLTGIKFLKDPGRFIGLFAGFVQLIAIAVSPQSFVATETLTYISFVESTVMHYILFTCGFISITRIEKLEIKKLWEVYLGLLIVLLWGVLAAFTWRYDTVNDKPENIMFLHECVLPTEFINAWPWIGQGHNFIIVYLLAFFIYTAAVYGISALAFKNQKKQEASIYGGGLIKKYCNR